MASAGGRTRPRSEHVPLWSFTARELLTEWHACARELGLSKTAECVYQLRHGGASRDRLRMLRSMAEIQRRGRWQVARSMRVYDKPGRLQQQLNATSANVMQFARESRSSFGRWFRAGSHPNAPRAT